MDKKLDELIALQEQTNDQLLVITSQLERIGNILERSENILNKIPNAIWTLEDRLDGIKRGV